MFYTLQCFLFQDPFGEKRGRFDYTAITQRLNKLKDKHIRPEDAMSDMETSDLEPDCEENNMSNMNSWYLGEPTSLHNCILSMLGYCDIM